MVVRIHLRAISCKCIPTTKLNNFKKIKKPWFNGECKKAIRKRKASLKKFEHCPTSQCLDNYRILRAKARRTVRQNKRKSWQSYVSSINSNTPITRVWDAIRKISGKRKKQPTLHLKNKNGQEAKTKNDIAELLAETFSNNSSSKNYSNEFLQHKSKAERDHINFTSSNDEEYNSYFQLMTK